MQDVVAEFPRALSSYTDAPGQSLWTLLLARIEADPFNAIATAIFLLAVTHTFVAARFSAAAHRAQARQDARAAATGQPSRPSVRG